MVSGITPTPIRVELKFCPAKIPAIKRIVVPEFPQSRGTVGCKIAFVASITISCSDLKVTLQIILSVPYQCLL